VYTLDCVIGAFPMFVFPVSRYDETVIHMNVKYVFCAFTVWVLSVETNSPSDFLYRFEDINVIRDFATVLIDYLLEKVIITKLEV
jgi:hypothetical protein